MIIITRIVVNSGLSVITHPSLDKYYNLQSTKYYNNCQVSHTFKSSIMLSADEHGLWKEKCLLKQKSINLRISVG